MEINGRLSARSILESMGSYNGQSQFEVRPYTFKDTMFVDTGDAIIDYEMFQQKEIHKQYREGAFKNPSQGVVITDLEVTHNIDFTCTAFTEMQYLKYFQEQSWFEFVSEHNELSGRIFLKDLISTEVVNKPNNIAAPVKAIQEIRNRIPDRYHLSRPIIIGAGKDLSVQFRAATGLVAAAYGAALTPYLPNASMTFTNADRGFSMTLWMKAELYSEARA